MDEYQKLLLELKIVNPTITIEAYPEDLVISFDQYIKYQKPPISNLKHLHRKYVRKE